MRISDWSSDVCSSDLRRRFPSVSLHLSDGNTRQIVERLSVLDLAFIEGEVPAGLPADTAVHGWQQDEVVAIARADHPLATKGAARLSDAMAKEHGRESWGERVCHYV